MKLLLVAGLFTASACYGQWNWEVGGSAGYGFYRNARLESSTVRADAGFRNELAAGFLIGEDMWEHISGEVRYTFHNGNAFLDSGSKKAEVMADSHAITYDVLLHLFGRDSKFRPFVAAGFGGKYYRGHGAEPKPQPVPAAGIVFPNQEWTYVGDWGGGFKYRAHPHVVFRVDFRDYVSPFPSHLFIAAPNATDKGILHQFTPLFGLSYMF